MVAAGVLVGVVAGAMMFSGGNDAPEQAPAETVQNSAPAADPAVSPSAPSAPAATAAVTPEKPREAETAQQTPPPAASPVALVYIRILDGETLKVNGEPKALRPAANGYASLKLPAGEAKIELAISGNGRTREQDAEYRRRRASGW